MASLLARQVAGELVGLLGLGRMGRAKRQIKQAAKLKKIQLQEAEAMERARERLQERRAIPVSVDPALVRDPVTGQQTLVSKGSGIAQGKLFPLGDLSLGPSTGAGQVFPDSLVARAQKNFRPTRLIVTSTLPDNTVILGVWIGTTLQQATRAAMSVRMFSDVATFAEIDFDVLQTGEDAAIDFRFTSTATSQTSLNTAQYYGTQF